jgi:hypothetical protein
VQVNTGHARVLTCPTYSMMANEHNIIYADAWLIHALALVGATMHAQGMKLKILPAHDVQRA